jgi:hypothetical protein
MREGRLRLPGVSAAPAGARCVTRLSQVTRPGYQRTVVAPFSCAMQCSYYFGRAAGMGYTEGDIVYMQTLAN